MQDSAQADTGAQGFSARYLRCEHPTEAATQPFGCHRKKLLGSLAVLSRNNTYEIEANTLVEALQASKPAVLRGLGTQVAAADEPWTDEYLRSQFGDTTVLVERKHEDRDHDPPAMSLSQFLSIYNGSDAYIVSVIAEPLGKQLRVPPAVKCTRQIMEGLQETNMWLSAGGTVSTVHNDADGILNCLLEGTKTWRFIEPRWKRELHFSAASSAPNEAGTTMQRSDFAIFNASAVDESKFPGVHDVPFQEVTVSAGDCVFVPPGHPHQVISHPGRNLAVSMIFMDSMRGDNVSELWSNPRSSQKARAPVNSSSEVLTSDRASAQQPLTPWCHSFENPGPPLSWADAPFVWKYSGSGRIPLGYMAPHELARALCLGLEGREPGCCGTVIVPTPLNPRPSYEDRSSVGSSERANGTSWPDFSEWFETSGGGIEAAVVFNVLHAVGEGLGDMGADETSARSIIRDISQRNELVGSEPVNLPAGRPTVRVHSVSSGGDGDAIPYAVLRNSTIPHDWQTVRCRGLRGLSLEGLRQLAMEVDGPAGNEEWGGGSPDSDSTS